MYKTYKHFDIDDIPNEMVYEELYRLFEIDSYADSLVHYPSYPFYCEDYPDNYWLNDASKFFIAHGAEKNELIYIDF